MITLERAPTVAELFGAAREVRGQKKAKQALAMLLRRQAQVARHDLDSASGAIVCGQTGVGKSMLSKAMCGAAGLPFAEVNATQYTEKGYVGPDLTQCLIHLMIAAAEILDRERSIERKGVLDADALMKRKDLDEVIKLAQHGVLLLDEFDKWMLQGADPTGRDKGRALQSELLKIVEGSTEWVTDSEEKLGRRFDTTRVMFLCCGAFVGLPARVKNRLHQQGDEQTEALWDLIEPQDFVNFGLLPELAGRLSVHIILRPLLTDDLIHILQAPGGLVEEYRKRFAAEDCRLEMGHDALIRIAGVAHTRKVGARGLRHTMERTFVRALYEASALGRPCKVVATSGNVEPPNLTVEAL